MRLFRAKLTFLAFGHNAAKMNLQDHRANVFEGQLFAVNDETELPDPRAKYPGNLAPYYEEIVPDSILVRQFSQIAKIKEL